MEKYFDYAATTPLSSDVLAVMLPYFSDQFYNPSSLYSGAVKVKSALNDSRSRISKILEVKSDEIIFTSGCTEANNLAIQGVMNLYSGKKILFSAIEHDSVRLTAEKYAHDVIPVDANGVVDLTSLGGLIDDDTVLISIMTINNEIGTTQPLRKIAKIVESVRKKRGPSGLPLYLHTDAAQAPNISNINASSFGVDMMSLSGSKIYGPKGVGCLYLKNGIPINPILSGGGQERGLRSGTENVANIVGFSLSLENAALQHATEKVRITELMKYLCTELNKMGGSTVAPPNSHIVAITFPGIDAEYLLYELDCRGYMVASGSACHASSGQKSHVLSALGMSDDVAKSTIRLSIGKYTTIALIKDFCRELKVILAKHKA